MRKILLVATLTAVTPWAIAQGTSASPAHFSSPPRAASHSNVPTGFVRSLVSTPDSEGSRRSHHSGPSLPLLSALGMFSDLYPNSSSARDASAAAFPSAAQAPNILLQALAPATTTQQPSASQPLLIELQGDRYVQLTGGDTSGNDLTYQAPAASAARSASALPNLRNQSARDVSS